MPLSEVLAIAPAQRRAPVGEALAGMMLTLPSAVAYLLLLLLPTLAAIVLAFTDYELGAPSLAWIGLGNFEELLEDRGFRQSLRNTLVYTAIVVPASIGGALALALLIEALTRGRALYRAVFFLPVVSLPVAMATAWQYLLHPTIGPLNALLREAGVNGPAWLTSSDTVLVALAAIGVWEAIGFNLVLFLAGLTAIPRELHQAAETDGVASAWERFRLVTWPLLGPTTLFVVTISMIRAVRTFDSVAVFAARSRATDDPGRAEPRLRSAALHHVHRGLHLLPPRLFRRDHAGVPGDLSLIHI